jgi:hypothetical protein
MIKIMEKYKNNASIISLGRWDKVVLRKGGRDNYYQTTVQTQRASEDEPRYHSSVKGKAISEYHASALILPVH